MKMIKLGKKLSCTSVNYNQKIFKKKKFPIKIYFMKKIIF